MVASSQFKDLMEVSTVSKIFCCKKNYLFLCIFCLVKQGYFLGHLVEYVNH